MWSQNEFHVFGLINYLILYVSTGSYKPVLGCRATIIGRCIYAVVSYWCTVLQLHFTVLLLAKLGVDWGRGYINLPTAWSDSWQVFGNRRYISILIDSLIIICTPLQLHRHVNFNTVKAIIYTSLCIWKLLQTFREKFMWRNWSFITSSQYQII